MCDTIVVVRPDGVMFAKNSDRDPNEAQFPQWYPASDHEPGSTVRCTYLEIPQVDHTHATLLSRPFWMWGAEIGANEHGVAIGNEAVFTNEPYADVGLTGMDMLRLALERSTSREQAIGVLVDLLESHGQGGGCGYEKRSFTYHNSFIVADREGATVLETAGENWATEEVTAGVRTISNGLTIPGFADEYRNRLRSRVSACDVRSRLTSLGSADAAVPGDLTTILRSHGSSDWPRYNVVNGTLSMPCMHGGGLVAGSSSTAGWVSDLAADTHWLTATSAQCLSLFKPMKISAPVDIGPEPGADPDERTLWWRHEQLARRVMTDPATLAPMFTTDRDRVEREWMADPPSGQVALEHHIELIDEWQRRVDGASADTDVRPWFARRYWNTRSPQ
ncbi:MAG: peptidase U34 [Actinomycetia bacterium]|nr:peptidase U34 [Actinomycetes bacterium]